MATQQATGKKYDPSRGQLYHVEHSLYDPQNGLQLKHNTIIQTDCENWVRRMGSCLGEIRSIPKQARADEVIVVSECVEDGGEALGTRTKFASADPASQLREGQSPEDEVGDERTPPARKFTRKSGRK